MKASSASKKHPRSTSFKRGGNGQHDISVLHRFVEELIGADHHFQFFKRHLAAIEIPGQTGFTGDPQHTKSADRWPPESPAPSG